MNPRRNNYSDLRRGIFFDAPLGGICYEPWGDALAGKQQYLAFAPQGHAHALGYANVAVSCGMDATAGREGQAFILSHDRSRGSAATAGDFGVAHTHLEGFACAGDHGVMLFPYLDAEHFIRYTVAYVGVDGILPNTYYHVVDETGALQVAPPEAGFDAKLP